MRTIIRAIDFTSEWAGRAVRWLCVALVLVITQEVFMRFVLNNPSMWVLETSMMLGATVYVFGWSYVHRHRAHIRVDVFYVRLPPRGQAIVDIIGQLLLFFPLFIVFTYGALDWAKEAWVTNERMVKTYWYPPFAPLRTLIALASILLLLQGAANFFRDFYLLIRNKPYD